MEMINEIHMIPTNQIKPYIRNPRKNAQAIEKLAELLPKTGFNVPLVLTRQNVIVKGHTRWAVAIKLGIKALPCVYTDADPEAIKLDRITDNKLSEYSHFDPDLLAQELAEIDTDIDLSQFDLSIDNSIYKIEPPINDPSTTHQQPKNAMDSNISNSPTHNSSTTHQPPSTPHPPPSQLETKCPNCGHLTYIEV